MLAFVAILVLALAVVLVLALNKPPRFTVQRTTEIAAPVGRILGHIEDFRQWADWSPWDQMDPTMTKTYSGPARGAGAVYEWEGNKKVGIGKMTLREVDPVGKAVVDLEFVKPFAAKNDVVFTLVPEGGVTRVSWAMHGASPFMFRVFSVFKDMDAMIGKDFEHGLAKLKAVSETG